MSVGSRRWSAVVASLVLASTLGCSSNQASDEADGSAAGVATTTASEPAPEADTPANAGADGQPDSERDSETDSNDNSRPDSGPTCDHYRTAIDAPPGGAKTAGEFVEDLTVLVELSESASPRVRAAARALFDTMGSAPISEAAAALNELVEACEAEGHQALG